jgi:predicted nuclease of predicted toxin-antitoxin system
MAERVRFYTDEHVPRAVVEGLRRRGRADGCRGRYAGARDEEHLAFARREGRVLFTQDADFLRLHAHGVLHAGIVYAHQQGLSTGEIIHGLMLVYEVMEADEMVGHLEYL